MSTTASPPTAHGVRPRQTAPALDVPLLRGGRFNLADQKPDAFTMIVFFRGLHCPVCHVQLTELNRRLDDVTKRGIDLIAVSGETRERTEQLAEEWKLDRLPLAYGLTEPQMRDWGLFVSRAVKDGEPALFNEPGLFLIKPDGTVYYELILSMPAGRPRLDDLLGGIDWFMANDYPARGEA